MTMKKLLHAQLFLSSTVEMQEDLSFNGKMVFQKSRSFMMPSQNFDDADVRHSFFVDACLKQNLTQLELSDCVNDNEMAGRRNRVTQVCDKMKEDPASAKKLVSFVDSKKIFVLKYR
jgi:hypothetical protein